MGYFPAAIDASGMYRFENWGLGTYQLAAIKGTFVVTASVSLVADGQVVRKDFILARGAGRVTGTVTDQGSNNQPVAATVTLSKGLGSRHWAAASISRATKAVAVTVSQSNGTVRIFQNGEVMLRIEPIHRRPMVWKDFEYEPPPAEARRNRAVQATVRRVRPPGRPRGRRASELPGSAVPGPC